MRMVPLLLSLLLLMTTIISNGLSVVDGSGDVTTIATTSENNTNPNVIKTISITRPSSGDQWSKGQTTDMDIRWTYSGWTSDEATDIPTLWLCESGSSGDCLDLDNRRRLSQRGLHMSLPLYNPKCKAKDVCTILSGNVYIWMKMWSSELKRDVSAKSGTVKLIAPPSTLQLFPDTDTSGGTAAAEQMMDDAIPTYRMGDTMNITWLASGWIRYIRVDLATCDSVEPFAKCVHVAILLHKEVTMMEGVGWYSWLIPSVNDAGQPLAAGIYWLRLIHLDEPIKSRCDLQQVTIRGPPQTLTWLYPVVNSQFPRSDSANGIPIAWNSTNFANHDRSAKTCIDSLWISPPEGEHDDNNVTVIHEVTASDNIKITIGTYELAWNDNDDDDGHPLGEYRLVIWSCNNPSVNATSPIFYYYDSDAPVTLQFTSPLSSLSVDDPTTPLPYLIGGTTSIRMQMPYALNGSPLILSVYKRSMDGWVTLHQSLTSELLPTVDSPTKLTASFDYTNTPAIGCRGLPRVIDYSFMVSTTSTNRGWHGLSNDTSVSFTMVPLNDDYYRLNLTSPAADTIVTRSSTTQVLVSWSIPVWEDDITVSIRPTSSAPSSSLSSVDSLLVDDAAVGASVNTTVSVCTGALLVALDTSQIYATHLLVQLSWRNHTTHRRQSIAHVILPLTGGSLTPRFRLNYPQKDATIGGDLPMEFSYVTTVPSSSLRSVTLVIELIDRVTLQSLVVLGGWRLCVYQNTDDTIKLSDLRLLPGITALVTSSDAYALRVTNVDITEEVLLLPVRWVAVTPPTDPYVINTKYVITARTNLETTPVPSFIAQIHMQLASLLGVSDTWMSVPTFTSSSDLGWTVMFEFYGSNWTLGTLEPDQVTAEAKANRAMLTTFQQLATSSPLFAATFNWLYNTSLVYHVAPWEHCVTTVRQDKCYDPPPSPESLPPAAIGGIIGGAIGALILFGICAWFVIKQRNARMNDNDERRSLMGDKRHVSHGGAINIDDHGHSGRQKIISSTTNDDNTTIDIGDGGGETMTTPLLPAASRVVPVASAPPLDDDHDRDEDNDHARLQRMMMEEHLLAQIRALPLPNALTTPSPPDNGAAVTGAGGSSGSGQPVVVATQAAAVTPPPVIAAAAVTDIAAAIAVVEDEKEHKHNAYHQYYDVVATLAASPSSSSLPISLDHHPITIAEENVAAAAAVSAAVVVAKDIARFVETDDVTSASIITQPTETTTSPPMPTVTPPVAMPTTDSLSSSVAELPPPSSSSLNSDMEEVQMHTALTSVPTTTTTGAARHSSDLNDNGSVMTPPVEPSSSAGNIDGTTINGDHTTIVVPPPTVIHDATAIAVAIVATALTASPPSPPSSAPEVDHDTKRDDGEADKGAKSEGTDGGATSPSGEENKDEDDAATTMMPVPIVATTAAAVKTAAVETDKKDDPETTNVAIATATAPPMDDATNVVVPSTAIAVPVAAAAAEVLVSNDAPHHDDDGDQQVSLPSFSITIPSSTMFSSSMFTGN